MKPVFAPLLIISALAPCGRLAGKAILLDGTPVAGAVVRVGTDSVATASDGVFSLLRSTGVAVPERRTFSVTRNLVLENGRLRLPLAGADVAGRRASAAFGRNSLAPRTGAAPRALAERDTLQLRWKDRRLVVLPVPSDTEHVLLRLDTAWSDDGGIPWNPDVAYGSVLDPRDGRTYRAVSIGRLSWMAENLGWRGASPDTFGIQIAGREREGRHYPRSQWNDALCPEGWRLPHHADWDSLTVSIGRSTTYLVAPGTALKSRAGWDSAGNGGDHFGFRGLAGGMVLSGAIYHAGKVGAWALDREGSAIPAIGRLLFSTIHNTPVDTTPTTDWATSIRCVKDAPAGLSGLWRAQAVLGSTASAAIELVLQADRFLLTSGDDTLYDGVVAERRDARWRLASLSGRLASRNPDGWIRLDTSAGDLFLHLISRRLTGSGNTAHPAGTWTSNSLPGGAGMLQLRSDSSWVRTYPSRSDSGTWWAASYPDALALRAGGIDGVFSAWLAGKSMLSVMSDPYFHQSSSEELWLDLVGDDAFLRFRRDP